MCGWAKPNSKSMFFIIYQCERSIPGSSSLIFIFLTQITKHWRDSHSERVFVHLLAKSHGDKQLKNMGVCLHYFDIHLSSYMSDKNR